jgi:hypothetical protein
MTSTKPWSDIDSGELSSEFPDAFDVGASALAGEIAGAFCSSLAWRLCGLVFYAFVAANVERPDAPSTRLRCEWQNAAVSKHDRSPPAKPAPSAEMTSAANPVGAMPSAQRDDPSTGHCSSKG